MNFMKILYTYLHLLVMNDDSFSASVFSNTVSIYFSFHFFFYDEVCHLIKQSI